MAAGFTDKSQADGASPSAAEADDIIDDAPTFVAGDVDEDGLSPEEKQARRLLLNQELERAAEEERKEQEKKQRKTGMHASPEGEGPLESLETCNRTLMGSIYGRCLRLHDEGDYLRVSYSRRAQEMSDRQLRMMILTAALEKNWSSVCFYKGRTEIDQRLTQRANAMIAEMSQPGMPLEGVRIVAQRERTRWVADPENNCRKAYIEPWNETGLGGAWTRNCRGLSNRVADMRDGVGAAFSCAVANRSVNMMFKKENGHDPASPPGGAA